MPVDDLTWFFSSEYGRDRLLRDELESASAAAASAARNASRLRSQLAQVQGSMEARLSALSRAFDAYVELGDVREQLIAFGDTRMIRRDAVEVIESLSAGVVPEPLDPERYDSRYWLLDAVNALVAVAAGRRDPELEARASAQDPSAEVFLVACATALGHGDQVVDLLASALTTDGAFDPAQLAVADAALTGALGPEGLVAVEQVVQHHLADERAGWSAWLHEQVGTGDEERRLDWVERLVVDGPWPEEPVDGPLRRPLLRDRDRDREPAAPRTAGVPRLEDPLTRLRALVGGLVAEGGPEERDLIALATRLRAQIEHPEASVQTAPETPAGVPVRDWVVARSRGEAPDARQVAREWLRPHLAALVASIPVEVRREPLAVSVQNGGWRIEAGPEGVDPAVMRSSRAQVERETSGLPRPALGCWVGGAVAVVLGLVTLAASPTAGGVLVVLGLLVGAAGFYLRTRARAEERRWREQRLADLDAAIHTAGEQLVVARDERARADAEHRARHQRLAASLAARGAGPLTPPR
ncbi:hypothetical protein [Auraticoccus monumenti]|uniref:Uncharacterized protein n=1 Tax=Auraticoccus monumenti TaxID=675864 RepID=A0A1G7CML7_9ACTN|nr:hypothetical protein [Auraticoccus monumenti]SDE39990.1 hypothetical protein SAMN04489747_3304 [Auraticoccus monumenti]